MDIKQAIIINEDLSMSKGKTAAQSCHASLNAYLKSDTELRSEWKSSGAKKIVLKTEASNFNDIMRRAETLNIPCYKVIDAGLTEIKSGSQTAIGLGPDKASKIDQITGELKLVN